VGAESADTGACLESLEELAHRVARDSAAAAAGEQRLLVAVIAFAVVGDVRVERFEGLDGKVDVAWVDRFRRRGSDVQAPLAEIGQPRTTTPCRCYVSDWEATRE
jgi:hypothetical protein